MYQGNSCWAPGQSSSSTSYLAVMREIHVLLVDHERDGIMNTAKLLEMCHYKVTLVDLASVALTMLASGSRFDFVMANINSPDLKGLELTQQANNMKLPIILMSVEDSNSLLAMRAMENGAFLYLKKPTTLQILECLWQHVIMMERSKPMTREGLGMAAANYNNAGGGVAFRDVAPRGDGNPSNISNGVRSNATIATDINGKSKTNGEENGLDRNDYEFVNNTRVKRKACTEWTKELHARFMAAVEKLGEGRCFPKEITELMNVPGLTRMQVASHLQKCRNDNWRSPDQRRAHYAAIQPAASNTGNGPNQKPRRFGSMPQLSKGSSMHQAINGTSKETGGSSQVTYQGSQVRKETETQNRGVLENMNETCPMVINTNPMQLPQYDGSLVHGGGVENMNEICPMVINTDPGLQRQNDGSLASCLTDHITPGTGTYSKVNDNTDDFFNFSELESEIQKYAGFPQGPGIDSLFPNLDGYHFNPPDYNVQNALMGGAAASNQWSASTSNTGNGNGNGNVNGNENVNGNGNENADKETGGI